jgi:hypothetical protein
MHWQSRTDPPAPASYLLRGLALAGLGLLLLAACGSPFSGDSVPPPPDAAAYEAGSNKDADQLFAALAANVRALLRERGYTLREQGRYRTGQPPAALARYYRDMLKRRGWEAAPNLPPEAPGQALLAYRRGDALFVVVALDIGDPLQQGVLLYTARAAR